jgi:hypothetical protein
VSTGQSSRLIEGPIEPWAVRRAHGPSRDVQCPASAGKRSRHAAAVHASTLALHARGIASHPSRGPEKASPPFNYRSRRSSVRADPGARH